VISIKPNGNQMFIGWYSRQNDPNNYNVDIYGRKLVYQYPGGWTWLPSFRITPQSFNGGSATTTVRLHDYDGAFADNTSFYMSWTDRRLASTRESDIYATRIPANPTQYYVFDSAGGVSANYESVAYAVNNASSPETAGFYREQDGQGYYWRRAYRGSPYYITSLLPTSDAVARDINSSRTTTGFRYNQYGWWDAWRLTSGGTLQFLQPLSSWWPIADGQAINDAGTVVGISVNNNAQNRATYWAAGGTSPIDMGTLNLSYSGSSHAFDLNGIGRTTGSADFNGTLRAFRTSWDYPLQIDPTDLTQNLGTLGGMSEGHAINEEGWVTGYSQLGNGQYRAFLCPPFLQMQPGDDFGTLGGTYSVGLGLNNRLTVVGQSTISSGAYRAFIRFRGGAMTDLNSLLDPVYGGGWVLQSAWDINDHGVVAGQGSYNGVLRGYVAYPMN
jgi:probable HAF family extracellular repeat protein